MKILKLIMLPFLLISMGLSAAEEDCESPAIPLPARELVKTLRAASEGLYKDVTTLKVNFDGDTGGKISVFYENGVPKLLKMTYTNKKGVTSTGQKTFEDLEQGIPLTYENKEKPGKAIILERGQTFKSGDKYSLKITVRSGSNPDTYTSYPIEFDSDMSAPKLSSNGKQFRGIVLSPGISMLSWDGTFKKVDFRN